MILQISKEFLDDYWDGRSPLLLGYSGGPDSKALLHALLECGVRDLHLAHVDHGWRPESACQAEELKEEAERLRLPFYSTRLTPQKGNQEEEARKARFAFFRSLFSRFPFQALLLAHQGDDWAETSLKRILEGAYLPFLGGMDPVSIWVSKQGGLPIWRPFLSIRKRDILQFLEERKLVPILDPTNDDPAYLRARMRKEILPQLSRSFGKGISDNLILLSQRASELKSYLDKKISQASIEHGVWGMYVSTENLERIEMRHLLQSLAREKEITFPRGVLESLLDWLEQKLPNKRVVIGNCHFITDRQGFYLLSEKKPISFLRSQRSQSVCFTSK